MKGSYTKEIKAKEKQLNAASELLLDVSHLEFDQRVATRNSLSVDLEILNQKNQGQWQPKYKCQIYKAPINL